MSRDDVALGEPADPAVLRADFPRGTAPLTPTWYRAHTDRPSIPDRGCWWFASFIPPKVGAGRFDLPVPAGTCYFADDIECAVRERLGDAWGSRPYIPASTIAGTTVSQVALQPYVKVDDLADTDHKAAARFITRELASGAPYALTQRHAEAFHQAGFGGILYRPRHTPGAVTALALFNDTDKQPSPDRPASVVPDWPRRLSVPIRGRVSSRKATVLP